MMYTCAPRGTGAASSARRKLVKRGNKTPGRGPALPRAHAGRRGGREADRRAAPAIRSSSTAASAPPTASSEQDERDPRASSTSIERRLSDMDKMGIDVQAISTSPSPVLLPDRARARAARPRASSTSASRRSSRRTRTASSRSARVPMQDPQLAVAELEYCMKKLGFRGLELGTNVRKAELSDERFEPFWAKAEELGAVIFLHPERLHRHQPPEGALPHQRHRQPARHDGRAGAHRLRRRARALPGTQVRRGARRRLHGPLPGAHGSRLQACARSATTTSSARRRYYMKKIYYDTMVFGQHAARAPGEAVGRGPRRDRHRLPVRHGLVQAGGFRERHEAHARAEGSIIGGNAAKLLGSQKEEVTSDR